MQRTTRWAAVLGAAALGGVAVLAIASFGGHAVPEVIAQNAPACMVNGITANPATGQTGIPTTFSLSTSNCTQTQTSALVVVWSFGDGTTGTTNPVTHTYTQPGMYNVVAQVTGSATATVSLQYTVIQGLTITTNGPYTGAVGQPITMTASGTSLPADTVFSWNFGDSITANGNPVSHAYSTSGTYTVTVTAASASTGRAGMATTTATIGTASPAPTLTISGPTTATAGQAVTYAVTPSGTVPSDFVYTWSFGDGTASQTGTSVTHTFTNAGTFTVTVNATSASTPSANTSASTSVVVSQAAPTGPQVTYPAGWNIVGGPTGTTFPQANGPLYTFQAGDATYESLANNAGIVGGRGYWAFFTTSTTVSMNGAGTTSYSVTAPAGQWIMVGNPSATQTLTVRGADIVYTYDPGTGYTATTTVGPGRGVWAVSLNGGTITVGP